MDTRERPDHAFADWPSPTSFREIAAAADIALAEWLSMRRHARAQHIVLVKADDVRGEAATAQRVLGADSPSVNGWHA